MDRLAGKVALVTGSGSGIGAEIARLFVSEGAAVLLSDIDSAAVEALAASLGGAARAQAHDVTCRDDWQRVVAAAEAWRGGLHILVNNAGIVDGDGEQDPLGLDMADWRKISAVNVEGTLLGCQAAIPAIVRAGGGAIVNISSIAALRPTPGLTAYGAAKAAVRQVTKSVAQYCGDNGLPVRCNSVHPGLIRTPMLQAAFQPAELARRLDGIPLRRLGETADVAKAVLYLASDDAAYVNGAKLVVDGGIMMD